MTVKEIAAILADINEVYLGYNGLTVRFDIEDKLSMIAYGNFIVERVYASGEGVFELNLAMQPISKE